MTWNLKICSNLIFILGSLFTSDAAPKESDDLYFVTLTENQIIRPKKNHLGTVVFLHGMTLESTTGISELMNMHLPLRPNIAHLKIIFPRAPQGPYTPHKGELRYIWFDQELITPYREEMIATFEKSYRDLRKIVQNELDSGVPMKNIIIGGFGMGGTMALHLAYRFLRNITGVFTIGSFLHDNSAVYKDLHETNSQNLPPLFMAQGIYDDQTLCLFGESTYNKLKDLEVQATIQLYQDTEHEVTREIMTDIYKWVLQLIPDPSSKKKKKQRENS